ncbi:hypothetical protein EDD17DRAFT_1873224 [Pisolithus thermaeus]|nr:hypothetical protein EDD17DRAFT_1873224 [Pisolithus thermaeus]
MAPSKDDEIDSETLQAQMDLSMSFAHNLVTSWIQTTQLAQPHPGISEAERILKEELQRPPRLGVGAPVPVASFASRDAAKLRHRLAKTADKALTSSEKPPQSDRESDEEEEKGKPLKRAKRNDPFTMPGLKKRRKVDDSSNKLSKPESGRPTNGADLYDDEQVTQKTRTETISREQSIHVASLPSAGVIPAEPATTTSSPTPQSSISRLEDLILSQRCAKGGDKSIIPAPDTDLGSTGNCPTSSPVSTQHSVSSKPARFSLLNLDGPPDPQEFGNSATPNISKKQRRRRKKKKNSAMMGTGTGAT